MATITDQEILDDARAALSHILKSKVKGMRTGAKEHIHLEIQRLNTLINEYEAKIAQATKPSRWSVAKGV